MNIKPELQELRKRMCILLCEGKNQKEIASIMGMTRNEVNWNLALLRRKIGKNNVCGLVIYAIEQGWFKIKVKAPSSL